VTQHYASQDGNKAKLPARMDIHGALRQKAASHDGKNAMLSKLKEPEGVQVCRKWAI
jgi:hypothetical protein